MRKRILITGGNGFVGRHLVRSLDLAHDVTVVDNLRYGQPPVSEELKRGRLIVADIRDAKGIAQVFERVRPEIVIHLAAIHYIPECETAPSEAAATNVAGLVAILDACEPGTRFVFTSSMAVYAPSIDPHQEELSRVAPEDVYGISKLQGEQFVAYFARKKVLRATTVRLTNVVGPGETNPHVIPAILAQFHAGNTKIRLGCVDSKRDYLDVRDAASAFSTIALAAGSTGVPDVVNVASGRAVSVREIVNRLARLAGCPLEIEVDPARLRPVDRPLLLADVRKVSQTYGWSATRKLDETLCDLLDLPITVSSVA